jgi:GNAT superfamily N-acetyltransferase
MQFLTNQLDASALSRIEDAALNASAPPQQRWLDGWLLRLSPGKAKRARCIHALAEGHLSLDAKLRLAADLYREAGLPMVLRITPFTVPSQLDAELAARGFSSLDDTRVMVCPAPRGGYLAPLPPGTHWKAFAPQDFAQVVGELRGSPVQERLAHAQRLAHQPVPCTGFAICRDGDGAVLACGQTTQEAGCAGLYDVVTALSERRRGLASILCQRLVAAAVDSGAQQVYLQVEASNAPARHIYRRLGFVDAYAYHYRLAPAL